LASQHAADATLPVALGQVEAAQVAPPPVELDRPLSTGGLHPTKPKLINEIQKIPIKERLIMLAPVNECFQSSLPAES
jgi:hypothetical protein